MVELKEIISDVAVQFLKEVDKLGGEISRGNRKHDYLTNLGQTFNEDTQRWVDEESPWRKGCIECWDKDLMRRSDSGYEGSYIRYAITEKGYEVLKLAK